MAAITPLRRPPHTQMPVCSRGLLLPWLLLSALSPLLVDASGVSDPPGRYSHCAVMYHEYMVVYGGRGFQSQKKTLTTIG